MPSVLGIDIGGTKIAAVRFDAQNWAALDERRIPTQPQRGFSAVLDDVVRVIDELKTPETIAVGVGVPGPVQHGVLRVAPNIPQSDNVDVASILHKRTGLPSIVCNDNQGFAYAEAKMGAGKGKDVVVAVAFGTGVGGGIVIDGTIFGGGHGSAGEFGHMLLLPGKPPFPTEDKRGEVEQFLSGKAWKQRCAAATKPEDYLAGDVCSFLHPQVYREVSWLCANVIYSFDPSVIVIGGSAGKALRGHVDAILKELPQWLLPNTPVPEIVISELQHAGMLGAALLAWESCAS